MGICPGRRLGFAQIRSPPLLIAPLVHPPEPAGLFASLAAVVELHSPASSAVTDGAEITVEALQTPVGRVADHDDLVGLPLPLQAGQERLGGGPGTIARNVTLRCYRR